MGAGGEQRRGRPQRCDVGAGVAGRDVGGVDRLAQRLGRAGEVGVGGGGQRVRVHEHSLSPRSRRAASDRRSSRRRGRRPRPRPRPGRPRPATAPARRAGPWPAPAPASGSSEPTTACTPVDCHQGPVSTQCAITARTFHRRPRHRNCSGPSIPVTMPLRTSTGSSYRLTCPASPSSSTSVRRPLPTDPCTAVTAAARAARPPGGDGGRGRLRRAGSNICSNTENATPRRRQRVKTRRPGVRRRVSRVGSGAGQPSSSSASSAPRRNSLVSGCQRK